MSTSGFDRPAVIENLDVVVQLGSGHLAVVEVRIQLGDELRGEARRHKRQQLACFEAVDLGRDTTAAREVPVTTALRGNRRTCFNRSNIGAASLELKGESSPEIEIEDRRTTSQPSGRSQNTARWGSRGMG